MKRDQEKLKKDEREGEKESKIKQQAIRRE